MISARAPGRVNLIGDHTDYLGGLVLPMAVDRAVSVEGDRGGDEVRLESESEPGTVVVPLEVERPEAVEPTWGRYVAGVVAELRPSAGFDGRVWSTVPSGAGMSSSAALEVAVALALGFEGPPVELARLCQRAEQRASGVPCGIMDQLTSVAGVAGHALRIDCSALAITPVSLPGDVVVVVVDSGEHRRLAQSGYAERRRQAEEAQAVVGPLASATERDLDRLDDPLLRRRARHVITENARVDEFVRAITGGQLTAAGRLMVDSHASLRDDYEVSTPGLDRVVDRLCATPGVHGARLTGGGFGGCVVALTEPGALDEGWVVRPSGGATVDEP